MINPIRGIFVTTIVDLELKFTNVPKRRTEVANMNVNKGKY